MAGYPLVVTHRLSFLASFLFVFFFVLPIFLAFDVQQFGPLSGVSHEVRVVSAYMAGLLEARSDAVAGVKMCIECGNKGHFPRHCPSAFSQ